MNALAANNVVSILAVRSAALARRVSEPMPDLSALIVAIAAHGDREAFARLFNHFAPRVKTYLLKLGTGPDTAEDLAQETLLNVWRRAAGFDPSRAAASTWIFAIARNLRIDLARRERRPLPGEDLTEVREDLRPDTRLQSAQDIRRIAVALSSLPIDQANVLRLAFFSDQAHSEIAKDLNLPLGTVKSRVRLAMTKLRAILEEGT